MPNCRDAESLLTTCCFNISQLLLFLKDPVEGDDCFFLLFLPKLFQIFTCMCSCTRLISGACVLSAWPQGDPLPSRVGRTLTLVKSEGFMTKTCRILSKGQLSKLVWAWNPGFLHHTVCSPLLLPNVWVIAAAQTGSGCLPKKQKAQKKSYRTNHLWKHFDRTQEGLKLLFFDYSSDFSPKHCFVSDTPSSSSDVSQISLAPPQHSAPLSGHIIIMSLWWQ